ncbi:hypothetical protein M426DRAFT_321691 [Hypoxylon sp. CI-4A]|nr:hypothetical protein M426DRAFT_321691 [Hypoxylon sp. CI-4A]
MTKLFTSVAAIQLVEKGLVTLDEDVSALIPGLSKQEIITGFAENGEPITKKRQNAITLRRLLTHSAGPSYTFINEKLEKVRAWRNQKATAGTVDEAFNLPLLFEPGEEYIYGTGIDRVGQLVEKLSGQSLEDYMRQNIWEPLGLRSTTFFPEKHPDIQARRVPISHRKDPKGPVEETSEAGWFFAGLEEPFGGQGLFSSMQDYSKLLYSLLVDDEKLLKKETTAQFFQPQLEPPAKASLLEKMEHPEWTIGNFPVTNEYDWGLGGLLVDGDKHPHRKRGTLIWSGAANSYWFIDRASGVCGAFGTHVFPVSDVQVRALIGEFEEEVYRKAGKL